MFVVFPTFIYTSVDGWNLARILTPNCWTSFAQMFSIRCLPGGAKTFSQASRRFLAYVFQGILTFKRTNLPGKFRNIQKNLRIIFSIFYFLFSLAKYFPSTVTRWRHTIRDRSFRWKNHGWTCLQGKPRKIEEI